MFAVGATVLLLCDSPLPCDDAASDNVENNNNQQTISYLRYHIKALLSMSAAGAGSATSAKKARWREVLAHLPALPTTNASLSYAKCTPEMAWETHSCPEVKCNRTKADRVGCKAVAGPGSCGPCIPKQIYAGVLGAGPSPPGSNPVETSAIFPGSDVVGLSAPKQSLELARNTITYLDAWQQLNGFPQIFPAANRVFRGEERVPSLRVGENTVMGTFERVINNSMCESCGNLWHKEEGGGVETAGAIVYVCEALLMSHEGFMRLFSGLRSTTEPASFRGLRSRDAFVVNASRDDRGIVTAFSVLSERGLNCTFRDSAPGASQPPRVTSEAARAVPVHAVQIGTQTTGLWRFSTKVGGRYDIRFVAAEDEEHQRLKTTDDVEAGARSSVLAACEDPAGLGERIHNHRELFLAPSTVNKSLTHAAWLAAITAWRDSCRTAIKYTGGLYNVEQLKWVRTSFSQPQMHPYDRLFYNGSRSTSEEGRGYTPDVYLADLQARYGGIDALLLWPTYPLLGLDDRSQFDMIESLPGGTAGLRSLIDGLHARGVKVLLPYLAWDVSTRPDPLNRSDAVRFAQLLATIHGNGANADSNVFAKPGVHGPSLTKDFYEETVKVGRPAAWEAESGTNTDSPTSLNFQVSDNGTYSRSCWCCCWCCRCSFVAADPLLLVSSLGYWGGMLGGYKGAGAGTWAFAPAIDKWKWLDSRRQTIVSDRWVRAAAAAAAGTAAAVAAADSCRLRLRQLTRRILYSSPTSTATPSVRSPSRGCCCF